MARIIFCCLARAPRAPPHTLQFRVGWRTFPRRHKCVTRCCSPSSSTTSRHAVACARARCGYATPPHTHLTGRVCIVPSSRKKRTFHQQRVHHHRSRCIRMDTCICMLSRSIKTNTPQICVQVCPSLCTYTYIHTTTHAIDTLHTTSKRRMAFAMRPRDAVRACRLRVCTISFTYCDALAPSAFSVRGPSTICITT